MFADLSSQLEPIDAKHVAVNQHRVELPTAVDGGFQQLHGLARVFRQRRPHPPTDQMLFQKLPIGRIVIHDQDGLVGQFLLIGPLVGFQGGIAGLCIAVVRAVCRRVWRQYQGFQQFLHITARGRIRQVVGFITGPASAFAANGLISRTSVPTLDSSAKQPGSSG